MTRLFKKRKYGPTRIKKYQRKCAELLDSGELLNSRLSNFGHYLIILELGLLSTFNKRQAQAKKSSEKRENKLIKIYFGSPKKSLSRSTYTLFLFWRTHTIAKIYAREFRITHAKGVGCVLSFGRLIIACHYHSGD